jgi:serine/threonine-protein kinase
MIDVLSGLDAAHELTDNAGMLLGVVHRDCSPQNILVGLDGCSRLTDFGIARASQRLATTRDGAMKGKIAYMAPEQTQGEDVDRRADLFSIGVVVWECLAQRRLFKRKADAAALRALLNDDIPLLSDIVSDIAPELVVCVARSLDRVPERRFQTAVAMADALEEAAGEEKGEGIATVREVEAHMRRQFGGLFGIQREEVRSYLVGTPSIRGFGGPVSQSGVRTSGAPLPGVSEPTRRGEAPHEEERTRVYGRQSGPEIAVPRRVRAAAKLSDVEPHVASSSLSSLPSAVASVSAVRSVPTDSISSQPPKVDGDTGIYPASTGGKSRAFMLLLGLSVLVLAGLVVHDFGVTPAPESAPSLVPVVVPPESPGLGAEADPTATPAKISPQAAASAERSRSETPPIGTAEKKKPQKTRRPRAQVPTRREDAVGSSRPVPATPPTEIPRPSAPDNQGGAPKPPKAVLAPPTAPKLKPAAPALDDDLANPYR